MSQIKDSEDAFMEISEENSSLRQQNGNLGQELLNEKIKGEISNRRLYAVLYIVFICALYWVYHNFVNGSVVPSGIWNNIIHVAYWGVCIGLNFINHQYLWLGLCSYVKPKYVENVMRNRITGEQALCEPDPCKAAQTVGESN